MKQGQRLRPETGDVHHLDQCVGDGAHLPLASTDVAGLDVFLDHLREVVADAGDILELFLARQSGHVLIQTSERTGGALVGGARKRSLPLKASTRDMWSNISAISWFTISISEGAAWTFSLSYIRVKAINVPTLPVNYPCLNVKCHFVPPIATAHDLPRIKYTALHWIVSHYFSKTITTYKSYLRRVAMMRFKNRTEAGRFLAERLSAYANRPDDTLVLGLPRGGVPVACEVATA